MLGKKKKKRGKWLDILSSIMAIGFMMALVQEYAPCTAPLNMVHTLISYALTNG